ncbi:MAG: polysaccharide biosynthesis/export family protein [Flavicella sp.]
MNKFIASVVLLVILSSCVPYKKIVYFQEKENYKTNYPQTKIPPYKLQVNDILMINIRSKDDELVTLFSNQTGNQNQAMQMSDAQAYMTGYSVDSHGNIRLPYIGELNVLGYTTDEVRTKVKEELKKYINSGNSLFVTVKLAGIRYTILGEISGAGTNVLYQNKVNIIEAISNSGDILQTGDRTQVEVFRKEMGELKKYTVDVTQLSLFDSEAFNILPNDIIYIRPIKTKTWGIGTTGLQTFTTFTSVFSFVITTFLLIQSL